MRVRTRKEYIESVRRRKPLVYMNGEKIDNIVDHPAFQVGLNSAAVTFEQANLWSDTARISPVAQVPVPMGKY